MSSDLEAALNADLDQVTETEPEQVEVEATAEAETETGEKADETAEARSTEQETSTPDVTSQISEMRELLEAQKAEINAFKQMAIDERSKRQEAEKSRPDFWEDPDQALSGLTGEVDSKLQNFSLNNSVMIMQSLHDDYSEMEAIFAADAEKNPALVQQMNQSGHPAKFAYEYGKNKAFMAEIQDPDAYKAKLKAEALAELEAENKAKIEAEVKKRSVPGSIANERSSGGTVTPTARPELEKLIGQ